MSRTAFPCSLRIRTMLSDNRAKALAENIKSLIIKKSFAQTKVKADFQASVFCKGGAEAFFPYSIRRQFQAALGRTAARRTFLNRFRTPLSLTKQHLRSGFRQHLAEFLLRVLPNRPTTLPTAVVPGPVLTNMESCPIYKHHSSPQWAEHPYILHRAAPHI